MSEEEINAQAKEAVKSEIREVLAETGTNLSQDIAKSRRPAALLATFGLVAITAGAVGGLVYSVIVNGDQQSLVQLGTLGTLGLGGLLALSGGKANNGGN